MKRTLLLTLKRYADKKEDRAFLTTEMIEWIMDEIYEQRIARTTGTPMAQEATNEFRAFLATLN